MVLPHRVARDMAAPHATPTSVTVYFLLFLCLFSHIAFPILTPHWKIVKNGQNSELFLRVFAVKLFTV